MKRGARLDAGRPRPCLGLAVAVLVQACGAAPESWEREPEAQPRPNEISAEFSTNSCPVFDWWLILPRSVRPGASAEIDVFAIDPDTGDTDLGFEWRATSGAFSVLDSRRTQYTCGATGWQVLTLSATDQVGCRRELPIDVRCLEP